VEVPLHRRVEAGDLLGSVPGDAIGDARRRREAGVEPRQPGQGRLEAEVVRPVGDGGEDVEARLAELQAIEGDSQVILRELPGALVVARLAAGDAPEEDRRLPPALALEEEPGHPCLGARRPGDDGSVLAGARRDDRRLVALAGRCRAAHRQDDGRCEGEGEEGARHERRSGRRAGEMGR